MKELPNPNRNTTVPRGNQQKQKIAKRVTKDLVNCFCSFCLLFISAPPLVFPSFSANSKNASSLVLHKKAIELMFCQSSTMFHNNHSGKRFFLIFRPNFVSKLDTVCKQNLVLKNKKVVFPYNHCGSSTRMIFQER